MLSKQEALTPFLSRRAMLMLGAGGVAALAGGIDPLTLTARRRLVPHWDELAPDLSGRVAGQEAEVAPIPRRLSHQARPDADALAEWSEFRRRFVAGDGRVIDNANGGVSHSEGQGWGMLLAVAFDDMAAFDLIADWTRRNLQVRDDALHAWRYVPQSSMPVADRNNATDGDLFIAAALWRAAWRWNRQNLADAAREIAGDILGKLVREVGGRTVLLPGAVGFEQARMVTVNPSYYILPVFEELAALRPSPAWARLRDHGAELLRDGRFGPWRLPPDWLQVDRDTGVLSPDPHRPHRFSYDAIRVPLWLSWSGAGGDAMRDFVGYWRRQLPSPPAWIDLSNNSRAPYPAPAGMVAIGKVALELSQNSQNQTLTMQLPALSASPDYYSAALTLLARCVWLEGRIV
jgi:endoglucanase